MLEMLWNTKRQIIIMCSGDVHCSQNIGKNEGDYGGGTENINPNY